MVMASLFGRTAESTKGVGFVGSNLGQDGTPTTKTTLSARANGWMASVRSG